MQPESKEMEQPILKVEGLEKSFATPGGRFIAVHDSNFSMEKGSCYGLVGESGSGKSTLALCVMALQPSDKGKVLYRGKDLLSMTPEQMLLMRKEIRMLFQHPEAVLNSGMTVKQILLEGLGKVERLSPQEQEKRLIDVLGQVRLEQRHLSRYPANLSAGEKQRVAIARALITKPKFLVCDEPVASLDLSIQSQILGLLKRLQKELGLTYLFISHNLPMVKLLADKIGVMYMGNLVEEAPVENFNLDKVRHPYSRLLLASVPSLHGETNRKILSEYPEEEEASKQGCAFRNRCAQFLKNPVDDCRNIEPKLRQVGENWRAACHQIEVESNHG